MHIHLNRYTYKHMFSLLRCLQMALYAITMIQSVRCCRHLFLYSIPEYLPIGRMFDVSLEDHHIVDEFFSMLLFLLFFLDRPVASAFLCHTTPSPFPPCPLPVASNCTSIARWACMLHLILSLSLLLSPGVDINPVSCRRGCGCRSACCSCCCCSQRRIYLNWNFR